MGHALVATPLVRRYNFSFMNKISFKKINSDNWLNPDSVMSAFRVLLPNGKSRPITHKEWFEKIYSKQLDDSVPIEISELIEVARGTMTYSYFFYPIFSFAAEQFTRIAETAITRKCESLKTNKSTNTFEKKINWLSQQPEYEFISPKRWASIRKLRNMFSHPKKQSIVTPAMAIGLMNNVIDEINAIYAK